MWLVPFVVYAAILLLISMMGPMRIARAAWAGLLATPAYLLVVSLFALDWSKNAVDLIADSFFALMFTLVLGTSSTALFIAPIIAQLVLAKVSSVRRRARELG